MLILSKFIYTFITTPIRIPKGIFLEPNKTVPKFISWSQDETCKGREIGEKLPQLRVENCNQNKQLKSIKAKQGGAGGVPKQT